MACCLPSLSFFLPHSRFTEIVHHDILPPSIHLHAAPATPCFGGAAAADSTTTGSLCISSLSYSRLDYYADMSLSSSRCGWL